MDYKGTKESNVIMSIGNNDIIFIINDKKVSLLKLVKRLDSKMDKITYGGVLAIIAGTVMAVPLFLANKTFDMVNSQNNVIYTQNNTITELKLNQVLLQEQIKDLESK